MATERAGRPEPDLKESPTGVKPPFVEKAEAQAAQTQQIEELIARQGGGKLVDASNRFTPASATTLTPEITQTPARTKTKVEEEADEILRKKKEEEEQEKKIKKTKPPKPPMSLRKKIALGATAAVMTTAGVGTAAYYTNDTFHEGVDNNLRKIGLNVGEVKVPSSFDNTKDKGIIGAQNIISLTPSAIKEMFPEQAIATDKSIQFLLPFDLPPGATVSYERNLTGQLGNNAVQAEAEKNGVKDNMIFTLPKGTTIFSPIDAHVMLSKGIVNDPLDNPNMATLVRVFYYDEKQDITYALVFFDTTDPAQRNFFQPLVPMHESAPDIWRGTNWGKLPTVKQGDSLVKTTIENQKVNINVRAYRGKKVGPEAEIIDKTFFLATPELLTTPGINGNQKIVGRQKGNVVE